MQEELFISGRNIPNIDPTLAVWHWPISVDLFLGGLAAGILFFSALFYVMGWGGKFNGAIRKASVIPPIALSGALLALVYDLTHPLYAWQLYTTFRIESPMSWGAWVLLFITPLSFLWAFSYYRQGYSGVEAKLGLFKKFRFLNGLEKWIIDHRKEMSYALIPLALSLGIYTGILLSAFNARPLWNNALLGPLFLISGLCTGAAAMVWLAQNTKERLLMSKIVLGLILVELALITHMVMGYFAGPQAQLEAIQLLVGGQFTWLFFGMVIVLGLVVPAIMEVMDLSGLKVPVGIPAFLILLGGLVFRFVMVDAGQLTRYLY